MRGEDKRFIAACRPQKRIEVRGEAIQQGRLERTGERKWQI
jgi:hypothetical protein